MAEKKSVLIIEDEVDLAKMMKVHIESKRPDYEVELAFDGESGLAAVNDMEPDMVILDINLPKKGGIELYKAISDKSGRSKVPVLVCTARGELGSFFEALDVAGFVDKPFEMEDLIRQIDRILSKEKQMIIFLLDQHTKPYISDVKNGLRRKGYKVIVVGDMNTLNREAAVALPDFVFVEFEHAGKEAIQQLKRSDLLQRDHKTYIISYNYSDKMNKALSMEAGADAYMGKPSGADSFESAAREFIEKIKKERREKELEKDIQSKLKDANKPSMGDIGFFKA